MGRGTSAELLHAIGEFADPPFHPFERCGAQGGGSEKVANLLGLSPDAFERLRFDRRRREAVDLAADGADFAFEPGDDRVGVVCLHCRAQFRRHRLERDEQRVAAAVPTRRLDALHEVSDRAFERDDRIARRKVAEAFAHRRDLGPHGA